MEEEWEGVRVGEEEYQSAVPLPGSFGQADAESRSKSSH